MNNNAQPDSLSKTMSHQDITALLRQYADQKQFTLWRNPTEKRIVLELHHETPKHGKPIAERVANIEDPQVRELRAWEERTGKRRFVIEAGQTALIPSEYDRAVQDVRDGIIVGGLGTLLVNEGADMKPVLHPALDAIKAERQRYLEEARKAKEEMSLKEDDLTVARRRIAELERLVAESPVSAAATTTAQASAKKDK
jgi:hypothetical protein